MTTDKELENIVESCGFSLELREEKIAMGSSHKVWRIRDEEGVLFGIGNVFGENSYSKALERAVDLCKANRHGNVID